MGALIIRAKWHLARDSTLSLGSLTTAASVPPPQKLWTTSCGSLARAPPASIIRMADGGALPGRGRGRCPPSLPTLRTLFRANNAPSFRLLAATNDLASTPTAVDLKLQSGRRR